MGKAAKVIKKMLDTLTGKSLDEAVKENGKTAADLKEAVKNAREKIDAERTAAEAAGRK